MKLKKFISIFLFTAMLITVTACGASNSPVPDTAQAPQTDTAAERLETQTPAPQTAEARKATLNVMMSFPQYMEQWEKYAAQFKEKVLAKQNVDVTINLEMPSSDQYESILQARLSGGDVPDVYTLHANNLATYYKAGNLEDLSAQPLAAKIYDNVKSTVSIDGKLLAVPIESMAWGVLYNKDIFAQYSLTPPDTLADLEKIAETLKANDVTPFMLAFQEQWVPQLMTALTLGGKVSGDIPDWVERMNADNGSYEEVREIFDVITLIMENGTSRAMEEGSEIGAADFAGGKAAMFVQGTWAANTIMTANPDFHLGVFPLPVNDNKACTLVNFSTSTTLAVHPDAKEKELALAFANYVLDDNDSSALFQSCGFNPLAAGHSFEISSWNEDAYKYVSQGRSYQDLVLPSSVTEEQGKLLQELYVGAVSVDDIITALDKAYKNASK